MKEVIFVSAILTLMVGCASRSSHKRSALSKAFKKRNITAKLVERKRRQRAPSASSWGECPTVEMGYYQCTSSGLVKTTRPGTMRVHVDGGRWVFHDIDELGDAQGRIVLNTDGKFFLDKAGGRVSKSYCVKQSLQATLFFGDDSFVTAMSLYPIPGENSFNIAFNYYDPPNKRYEEKRRFDYQERVLCALVEAKDPK